MMQFLYRFVRGFLQIVVRGKNTTRFLNLCASHQMELWDVECEDDTCCHCCIALTDFYRLRALGRKTKVKVHIEMRRGLPFVSHRYRTRKVFVLVFFLVIAGIGYLTGRIWRIEVTGNSSLGEESIIKYLENKNIRYGVAKSSIDNDALELSFRQDFDEVIWASVYEEGTKLVVCLQEKIAQGQEPVSDTECMDLVADKDAVIASIITRSGVPYVKAGDTVKAGDIVVCGRQEILDDNGELLQYFYRSADADVMVYTSYDYEDEIPLYQILSTNTGNTQTRRFLRVNGWQFTTPKLFADYDEYETLEETQQLCLLDSCYLPVYFGTIRQFEQQKVKVEVSMDDAKTLALEHFNQFLSDLEENGVRIRDKNVMIEKIEKKYHIYGQVDVCEKIARQAPTEVLEDPPKEGSSNEFE